MAPLVCHQPSNGKARSNLHPIPLLLSSNFYVATVEASRLNHTSLPPQSTGTNCNSIIQPTNPSLLATIHDSTSFRSMPTIHVRVLFQAPFSHFTATDVFSFPTCHLDVTTLLIPFVFPFFFSAPSPLPYKPHVSCPTQLDSMFPHHG